jgi:hypothetical protein
MRSGPRRDLRRHRRNSIRSLYTTHEYKKIRVKYFTGDVERWEEDVMKQTVFSKGSSSCLPQLMLILHRLPLLRRGLPESEHQAGRFNCGCERGRVH